MLFNKDIYVIRNFCLRQVLARKVQIPLGPHLASPGALNLLWKELAVTSPLESRVCGKGNGCTGSDRRIHHGNQVPLWRIEKKCSSSVSSDVRLLP